MRILALLLCITIGQPLHAQVRIALLGVGADMDLVQRWAGVEGTAVKQAEGARYFRFNDGAAVVVAPEPALPPGDIASLLYEADVAVIVVDATEGPLPINREHIILARQAHVPTVSILLANVDELHALEPGEAAALLQLEAAEMRAVMDVYELDGRSALLYDDARSRNRAPGGSAGGLDTAGSKLAGIGKRRDRGSVARTRRQARGQVYLLTDAEVNGRGASISGPAVMGFWSEGSGAMVQVSAQGAAGPGDVASVSILAQRAFRGAAGSRFLLIDDDRVVGIGVLTEVGP